MFRLIRKLFYRVRCEHTWHPCAVRLVGWNEYKPARMCSHCKEWEPLAEQDFYSQFGESFLQAKFRCSQ
jgi:hypothetical protein